MDSSQIDYLKYLKENHEQGEMSDELFIEMVQKVLDEGSLSFRRGMRMSKSLAKAVRKGNTEKVKKLDKAMSTSSGSLKQGKPSLMRLKKREASVEEDVANGTYTPASEMESDVGGAKNIVNSIEDIHHAFRIKRTKGVSPKTGTGDKEAY